MTLKPGERAANPAHKYPQPDFSTLWWWKDAWSPQTMEWFLTGDVTRLTVKLSILFHYNSTNPGDATGKSLPDVEWLMEYFIRLGENAYENSQKVFRHVNVDLKTEPDVSPAVLLACYYAERVRTLAEGGYDYHMSGRASLLLRSARLTEADWRHLHSIFSALQAASKVEGGYRSKLLLNDILRAISANPTSYELTGEEIIESPMQFSVRSLFEQIEADDAGMFNTQLSEIVRNPSTPESLLEQIHAYLTQLEPKEVRSSEVIKQPLRWVEAHPNWTKPPTPSFSLVEEGEDEQYFIGYDIEVLHPTMVDDLTSELTPPEMRLDERQLHASLTLPYTEEDGWEDDPALWNGTRVISGYHALRHFTPEQVHDLVIEGLIDPLDSREERLAGVMPAFGAVLARITEPFEETADQIPLEWILEMVSSPKTGRG